MACRCLRAGFDDYLDDDDLDLIEENLGVKVKRRVRSGTASVLLRYIAGSRLRLGQGSK